MSPEEPKVAPCIHPHIKRSIEDDGTESIFWECEECHMKFIPYPEKCGDNSCHFIRHNSNKSDLLKGLPVWECKKCYATFTEIKFALDYSSDAICAYTCSPGREKIS